MLIALLPDKKASLEQIVLGRIREDQEARSKLKKGRRLALEANSAKYTVLRKGDYRLATILFVRDKNEKGLLDLLVRLENSQNSTQSVTWNRHCSSNQGSDRDFGNVPRQGLSLPRARLV
jgi:hypothetical protein